MNIALIADDGKKELMVQFCIAYCGILAKHDLSSTFTTGRLISEATGLTPIFEDGTTCFAEAKLVLECKKIYQDKIRPEGFLASYIKDCYPQEDYHIIYMGEILKVLTK